VCVGLYVCVYVNMYVCSLIARERMNQFAPTFACIFLKTRRISERSKIRKMFLSLSPGKGGYSSPETKNGRRTALSPQFVSEIT
jgi:hypothetical protein